MANVGGLCVALISRLTSNSVNSLSVFSELEKYPSASQLLAIILSEKLCVRFLFSVWVSIELQESFCLSFYTLLTFV